MLAPFIEIEDEIEVVPRDRLPIAHGIGPRQRRHLLNKWDPRRRQPWRLSGSNCTSGYNGRHQERATPPTGGAVPVASQVWNPPAMDKYVHLFDRLPLGPLSGT